MITKQYFLKTLRASVRKSKNNPLHKMLLDHWVLDEPTPARPVHGIITGKKQHISLVVTQDDVWFYSDGRPVDVFDDCNLHFENKILHLAVMNCAFVVAHPFSLSTDSSLSKRFAYSLWLNVNEKVD